MSDEKYYKIINELKLSVETKLAFLEYVEQETDEKRKQQTTDKFLDFARAIANEEKNLAIAMSEVKNKYAQSRQEARESLLEHIKLLEVELSELSKESYIAKLRKSIENI
jgi:hypothetical protein